MRTFILLGLTVFALLVMPQLTYAGCQIVTITENGESKTCTVCTVGSSTTITCF